MDYDEVIVHIFFESVRGFYDLEGLWMDSPRLPILPSQLPPEAA
jgi:ribosome-associated protein